jgi:DNA-nicking Smr family endonuclease
MSADDGKPKRRKLSEEERTLWNRVTRAVAPLPRRQVPVDVERTTSTAGKIKATPSVRAQVPMRAAAPATKTVPKPAPKPALSLEPLDRKMKRRLARGTVEIDARLDLHGKTQSQAHAALLRFLRKAQGDGARFVLVITGKGSRDDGSERGVLKRQVPLWLKLPEFRGYVVGIEDAHAGHGGEGALYLKIKRQETGLGSR